MYYFVVHYIAHIEGNQVGGTIGSTSSTKDYKPNTVKTTLIEHYKKKYPDNRISVTFPNVQEVNNEAYIESSRNFIDLNM